MGVDQGKPLAKSNIKKRLATQFKADKEPIESQAGFLEPLGSERFPSEADPICAKVELLEGGARVGG
jgi:hypothetical protein